MLPLHPPGRLALSLLLPLALALGGCASDTVGTEEEFRTTLYLAVAIGRDDVIDSALQQEIRGSVDRLQEAFGAIQPRVRFQVELHREDRLVDHLRRRNRSGLGPDLLLVPGEQAAEMESLQLTRAVRFPESATAEREPGDAEGTDGRQRSRLADRIADGPLQSRLDHGRPRRAG